MSPTTVRVSRDAVRDAGRLRVQVEEQSVVVFALDGGFVAYVDVCSHLGGPVCSQGTLHPFYTARVEEDGTVEPYFAPGGERVIACPWHGWEYDLTDGHCLADQSKSLRAAKVIQDRDELVVSL